MGEDWHAVRDDSQKGWNWELIVWEDEEVQVIKH